MGRALFAGDGLESCEWWTRGSDLIWRLRTISGPVGLHVLMTPRRRDSILYNWMNNSMTGIIILRNIETLS